MRVLCDLQIVIYADSSHCAYHSVWLIISTTASFSECESIPMQNIVFGALWGGFALCYMGAFASTTAFFIPASVAMLAVVGMSVQTAAAFSFSATKCWDLEFRGNRIAFVNMIISVVVLLVYVKRTLECKSFPLSLECV